MKKNKGAALLVVVLITFILMAILSSIAFSIVAQTKKNEVWQMEHKHRQMTILARSAVIAAAEALSNDASMLDASDKTASIEIKDGSDKVADLTLVISTDSASTAKIYATAKTESKKVTIIGMYSIGSRTITGWDRTEDD